jgi:hypothetical protein
MGIDFDLSRFDVEALLGGFLAGTQGVKLGARLKDLDDLPAACRTHVRLAHDSGRVWTAWVAECGPMAAWGDYDIHASKQILSCLLFIEWWTSQSGHHSLWCYCDPKRPTEWTIGRGRHGASP